MAVEEFKTGDHVVDKNTGLSGVVLTPAYDKVPYVQVDYGSHINWCYPHELDLEEDILITEDTIPQYAKDVLYGYREGYKAAEAKYKTQEPEPTPKSRGFADVYTEANEERKRSMQSDIARIIYHLPPDFSYLDSFRIADNIIALVREAYPNVETP